MLLEKDVANLYYYHYCVMLHHWDTSWGRAWRWPLSSRSEFDLSCKQHLRRNSIELSVTRSLSYHHAHLIMNRHLYGSTHGVPINRFEEREWWYRRNPISEVWDFRSLYIRIIDKTLMTLSIETMFYPGGKAKRLRNHIEEFGHSVCAHLSLGNRRYNSVQLPEVAKDKSAPRYIAPCDQSFGSCPFCLTDYCIDISWGGDRKGYIVIVSAYRQLGDCRSPFDWSWRSMTTLRQIDEPRIAHPLEYRPGVIRDRWNKADGIDGRTPAEWAEIPRQSWLWKFTKHNK
jgi:hypothetical protein